MLPCNPRAFLAIGHHEDKTSHGPDDPPNVGNLHLSGDARASKSYLFLLTSTPNAFSHTLIIAPLFSLPNPWARAS